MEDSGKTDSETVFSPNGANGYIIDPTVTLFVNEFLEYKLGQNGYQWTSPQISDRAAGSSVIETKVGVALRSLADDFASQFKEQFVEMCETLDISAQTMQPTIEGVANELFSEGIKWARIVAFFVFGSELALHCKNRNCLDLINIIAYSLSSYISEKLLPWINEHGGWEGLVSYNEEGRSKEGDNKWPSAKNLLYLGISALGISALGAAVFTKY